MKRAESAPHPLFHSLVMMGGTVAVACGGVTSGSGDTGIGQAGAGGGGTGPGTGGAGGTPGAGGSVETGGVAATGGTSAVHIWPCPPAQFVCDQATSDAMACGSSVAPEPGGCLCDETRPLTADECPPSSIFVCRVGHNYTAGTVTDTFLFECSCASVSADSAGCKTVFDTPTYYGDGYWYEYEVSGADGGISSLLCGCSFVYLR